MIKYDYLISRDEGDEMKRYIPNLLPKELSDVVYIEGPNSSGKSTLLNLIALAFFGLKLKSDELNPALRERLENLVNSSHQELKFELEVSNPNLSIILKAAKPDLKNKELTVKYISRDGEKHISPEQFRKEFRLIYDIPDNPLERLEDLLIEIKNTQRTLGNQVITLRNHIKQSIDGVKNAKDPKQLERQYQSLNEEKNAFEEISKEIDNKTLFLNQITLLYQTKFFLDYSTSVNKINTKIKHFEKKKIATKKEVKKQSKEQESLLKEIKVFRQKSEKLFYEIYDFLKLLIPTNEKHHLTLWSESECAKEINEPEVYQSLRNESKFFINFLTQQLKDEVVKDRYREVDFLNSLLELLQKYSYTKIIIPGTDKTINDFISILNAKIDNYDEIIVRKSNIENCLQLLNEFQKTLIATIEFSQKFRRIATDYTTNIDEMKKDTFSEELNSLCDTREKLNKKLEYFRKELLKAGLNFENAEEIYNQVKQSAEISAYEVYTESQLFEKINTITSDLSIMKHQKTKLEKSIEMILLEIKRLEKKKPHKYQNYLERLEHSLNTVQNLERKLLVNFHENIENLTTKKYRTNGFDASEQKYISSVSRFLADKVRYIRHINNDYKIIEINVIDKEILTLENKVIKFTDIGTGQSQAAYLKGLLNVNDNRKIIALFDEVAMMDSNTLQPILNTLVKLYNEKKLLIGMVVQKSDELNIKRLV